MLNDKRIVVLGGTSGIGAGPSPLERRPKGARRRRLEQPAAGRGGARRDRRRRGPRRRSPLGGERRRLLRPGRRVRSPRLYRRRGAPLHDRRHPRSREGAAVLRAPLLGRARGDQGGDAAPLARRLDRLDERHRRHPSAPQWLRDRAASLCGADGVGDPRPRRRARAGARQHRRPRLRRHRPLVEPARRTSSREDVRRRRREATGRPDRSDPPTSPSTTSRS